MDRERQKNVSTEIVNLTEEEERAYLDRILQELEWAIEQADRAVREYSREFRQNQAYLFDQRSGMDEADVVSAGQSLTRMTQESEIGRASCRERGYRSEVQIVFRINKTRMSR